MSYEAAETVVMDKEEFTEAACLPRGTGGFKLLVGQVTCGRCGGKSVIYSNSESHVHACFCGYRAMGSKYEDYWAHLVNDTVDELMDAAKTIDSLIWCTMTAKRIKNISIALERRSQPRT